VIAPLPVQRTLPLWIGGSSEAAIARTARIGTGWMGGRETPEQAGRVVSAIQQAAAAAGRCVPEDHFGVGVYFRIGAADDAVVQAETDKLRARFPDRDPAGTIAAGDPGVILARLREYVAAGVTKFVLRPVACGDDDFIAQTRRYIEQVQPELGALAAFAPA
jgi:alkanesulfonate monooxygenase SsuD/methylene tetrahydromethanopterin reductase-like flavin-dependent oxidoreductase (luciferase family)